MALFEALRLWAGGWNVLPVALDGSKAPLCHWKQYKTVSMTERMVRRHFCADAGIGVIGGRVSGNAELLDFDNHDGRGCLFYRWLDLAPVQLLKKLVFYKTPDGWRAAYRCDKIIAASKEVLAKRDGTATIELLANQFAVVPGGAISHKSGKPYVYAWGSLASVNRITVEERQTIIEAARALTEKNVAPKMPKQEYKASVGADWWPSDDFNLRGQWDQILEPHGWEWVGNDGSVGLWRRPGKATGVSATTNHAGLDLLHVFSSSTPFEADKSINKFAAYTILSCGGDWKEASKKLAQAGYGYASCFEKVEKIYKLKDNSINE